MLYTLQNETLTVRINSCGAELTSVRRGDCEYIWQGDARYWEERAPVLFPICGRLWGGTYTLDGKTYEMGLHGFVRGREFSVEQTDCSSISFLLRADAETRRQYPYDFILRVAYRLDGDTLHSAFCIQNKDDRILYATVGAHPGFCVPLDGKGDFSDYYLEFAEPCSPDELLLSSVCYASGKKRGMTLQVGKRIQLERSLFDSDGIFMNRMADRVTLKSDQCERFVTLHYPDMPYLGIWQPAHTDAPFVCIEPWCGFAGYDGVTEDLATKPDMFRISAASEKTVRYSIQFG